MALVMVLLAPSTALGSSPAIIRLKPPTVSITNNAIAAKANKEEITEEKTVSRSEIVGGSIERLYQNYSKDRLEIFQL